MKEGSWLYVYDEDFKYKMLRIPLGVFLVIRDNIFHGGFCGSVNNVRMQITLIPKTDIGKFRWLTRVSKKVADKKGYYNPQPVDYCESVYIFDEDVKKKLKKQSTDLENNYSDIDTLYSVM